MKLDGISINPIIQLRRLKKKVLEFQVYVVMRREFLGLGRRGLFRLGLILPRDWKQNLVSLAAGSLILFLMIASFSLVNQGLVLKKEILGTAVGGFDYLQGGEFELAGDAFEKARNKLQGSQDFFSQILNILPPGQDVDRLFEAGVLVSSALSSLTRATKQFEISQLRWDAASNSSDQQFYFFLKETREDLARSLRELERATSLIEKVNLHILPTEFHNQFLEAGSKLVLAQDLLDNLVGVEGLLLSLLGGEEKTYLLIFQNNNEARATGGFIGTYGILKFANGRMKIDRIESIYVLDGQLVELIAAPGPMQRLLTPYWGTRDSNWFVDFPTSARKILSFLEKRVKILVDGVISMTPDVFERLLEISGPIEMPEYGETLTAQNFRSSVQYKTSIDYNRQLNQPKKFLADFAPRMLAKFSGFNQSQQFEVLNILAEMMLEKQILMFSIDPDLEKEILRFGLGGEIKKTDGDYLAIFHSNLGAGKTDIDIKQRVEKQVSFEADGELVTTLKITREHRGFDEKFYPKNVDFMRILVPPGSRLLGASGFDNFELPKSERADAATDSDLAFWDSQIERAEQVYVGSEAGYTMFASWLELLPGESKTVELTYKIPKTSDKIYALLLQKQPGAPSFEFKLEISYPGQIVYSYPERAERKGSGIVFLENVGIDRFYAILGE